MGSMLNFLALARFSQFCDAVTDTALILTRDVHHLKSADGLVMSKYNQYKEIPAARKRKMSPL